jgi:hypothetical protein
MNIILLGEIPVFISLGNLSISPFENTIKRPNMKVSFKRLITLNKGVKSL